ncbi:hypothetical protein AVEN_53128-1 [Araneus ventricosus]|uniref:Uncharacterized protein n=1 Tax=Araneus ventricosus TaxID=182803 RepID=A0A4Y2J8A9_ARAVE|nr:hypothetical protein AVEN_53128-1 [Araneus ventricosus]
MISSKQPYRTFSEIIRFPRVYTNQANIGGLGPFAVPSSAGGRGTPSLTLLHSGDLFPHLIIWARVFNHEEMRTNPSASDKSLKANISLGGVRPCLLVEEEVLFRIEMRYGLYSKKRRKIFIGTGSTLRGLSSGILLLFLNRR